MKKILLSLSVVLVAAMLLVSCSKNSPKDVANTWLTSFYQMDYEGAKKVSTDETKTFLSQLQALSAMVADSVKKKDAKKVGVTIKDCKEEGDKCTCTYTSSDEAGKDQTLKLVKKDGKWLVQFSKTDQGGAGDAGMGGSTSGGSDSTGAPVVAPTEAPAGDTAKH